MTETHGAARPGQLSIDHTAIGDIQLLTLRGEIDHSNRDQLRQTLLPGKAATRTVLDLSGVTFLDSSGINTLLVAHQSMSDAQGWLRIAGARDPVLRVLRLVGLDQLIPCHSTVEQATAV
ncbi:STAS domain-containing protein [Streptomyces bottropensis]|uniref:STAS domain-containing protein n=1 Tax=Streptomyces bottropensis TaxID=42235 RepID=UPI0037AF7C80